MSSYMGIGQWAATFSGDVPEGQVAKISGSGAVSACAAGEAFCGVVISAARDGAACSVALGGMLTAAYRGAAPALGWTTLTADGSGGVKAEVGEQESGVRALAVEVDTAGKYVTFVL